MRALVLAAFVPAVARAGSILGDAELFVIDLCVDRRGFVGLTDNI